MFCLPGKPSRPGPDGLLEGASGSKAGFLWPFWPRWGLGSILPSALRSSPGATLLR